MPKETDVYRQIARYLNLKHPGISYHFDLAGVNNPSMATRVLYSQLNGRSWPDLFIAATALMGGSTVPYAGLLMEIKREGERIRKRDGWASEHIAGQAAVCEALRKAGYAASIVVGFDQAVEVIEQYLAGELRP